MTGSDIITAFEQQVSDLTELSTVEELRLLNKVYHKVCADRPWEFVKTTFTGTQSTSVPYISLPSDFSYLTQNDNWTDRSYYAGRPVVFVGANYDPYDVVSWSDRRSVRTDSNKCYIDIANSRLYFTVQPTSAQSVEFDYAKVPTDLLAGTSPIFPARFHHVLVHLMAMEDFILQLSDKAKSYAPENKAMADSYIADMCEWNANLVQI